MDLKRDLVKLRLADQGAKRSTSREKRVRVYALVDKQEIVANGHDSPSNPVRCL